MFPHNLQFLNLLLEFFVTTLQFLRGIQDLLQGWGFAISIRGRWLSVVSHFYSQGSVHG